MTKQQLIEKVNDCLNSDKAHIQKSIEKAIASGCMDIEGAEDNFILPKDLLCAVYREMMWQYSPSDNQDRKRKRNIDNIYAHL